MQDLSTHEIVRIIVGFYYTGAAKWELAASSSRRSRATAEELGDWRRLADAVGNLMELEFLQGSSTRPRSLAS